MAKNKVQQAQMDDQVKKQEYLSTRLQGPFKKAKGKHKQNRGNSSKGSTEKSQCPEIIIVESYTNTVGDPNPCKIPVLETRESITQKKFDRKSGDRTVKGTALFNFGCDFSYPVFRQFFGLASEDCFGIALDGDYLAMKEGSWSHFRGREAGVGRVEFSTDDMLKEFIKENLFN